MTKKRKFLLPFFALLVCGQFSYGQKTKTLEPDTFLIPNKDSLPKIFLVGTFHFEYYNADAYKIDKENQVDILSDKKQKEIKQLLDYVSLFKPTKILIEAEPNWNSTKKFRDYRDNKQTLGKDERMQIGFRLAERFKLDTLYSIDEGSLADDLMKGKDSTTIIEIFKDYQFTANDNYNKFRDYDTKMALKLPLLEYFKYANSPKNLLRDYGSYLLGDFKLRRFDGADALALEWYNRNLRIFRNIQRIATSPNDRVLVLFGSGHIAILDQLFKASPEFDYIKFGDLKK
jgi:hypothetical protein